MRPRGKVSSVTSSGRVAGPKRLQSAMEYLMTYGWSILIIAIVVAALFELGVFGGSNFSPKAQPGNCRVSRPYGAGSTSALNLQGICSGELPQYVGQFNGVNSIITVSNMARLPTGNGNRTLSAWFEVGPDVSADNDYGIAGYGPTTNGKAFYIALLGPAMYTPLHDLLVDDEYNTIAWMDTGYVVNSNWNQVTVVYGTSNTATVYLNGQIIASGSHPAWNTSTSTFYIGYDDAWPTHAVFTGYISNVQMYNSVLDANTIQAMYNEGIGGAPVNLQNLIAWWPLNGDINDYSGNGQNGVASNLVFTSSWTNGYTLN